MRATFRSSSWSPAAASTMSAPEVLADKPAGLGVLFSISARAASELHERVGLFLDDRSLRRAAHDLVRTRRPSAAPRQKPVSTARMIDTTLALALARR
jgi:hypothetical protein